MTSAPKHYLKQFTPKYVSAGDLDKMVKDAGFEDWTQLFKKNSVWCHNTEMPVIGPWMPTNTSAAKLWRMERNPYFYEVDGAGNQLPYIDEMVGLSVRDRELLNLHAVAGEVDAQGRGIDTRKLTLFLINGEREGYRVVLRQPQETIGLFFNITHGAPGLSGDPEVGKWMRNIKFREAFALAVDRDEMKESVTSHRVV